MSKPTKQGEKAGQSGLFEAGAPRPLADRLRPQTLDAVVIYLQKQLVM